MATRKPKVTPHQAFLEMCSRSPSFWRDSLIIRYDGDKPVYWKSLMSDLQRKDFAALDPAFVRVAGRTCEKAPYQKFWIQRSRGFCKSTDVASLIGWAVAFSKRAFSGILVAGDKEQAQELRKRLVELLSNNSWMMSEGWIDVQKNCFISPKTEARIDIMSADTHTAFGATPEITICSEFCNWRANLEEFYEATISSSAKTEDRGGIFIVETNAGSGSGYQWRAHEAARTDPAFYFSAPEGWAPWYSESTIAAQKRQISPREFQRLWLNQWSLSDGAFITLQEAESCIDKDLEYCEDGVPTWPYVAVVDVGLKNDRTVMTVMHQMGNNVIIDRMDVFDPQMFDGGIVPIEIVELWMRDINERFSRQGGSVYFVVDEYQMVSTIRKLLEEGYAIIPFQFQAGMANWKMGYSLQQLIANKRLHFYKDCGAMYEVTWDARTKTLHKSDRMYQPYGQREDFCTELAALEKIENSTGRWRFTHTKEGHDDRAFTVGAGILFILENSLSASAFDDIISRELPIH